LVKTEPEYTKEITLLRLTAEKIQYSFKTKKYILGRSAHHRQCYHLSKIVSPVYDADGNFKIMIGFDIDLCKQESATNII
jgi:hypothetical protein